MPAFSWSALSTLQKCPLWFHAQYVAQRTPKPDPEAESKALSFGNWAHGALAERLVSGKSLPSQLASAESFIASLCKRFGSPAVEYRMAVDADWEPVEFFDARAFVRGVLDAFWYDRETKANLLVDWKTGKPEFFDTAQLELQAFLILARRSELNKVAAAFAQISQSDPCSVTLLETVVIERKDFDRARRGDHDLSDLLRLASAISELPEEGVDRTPGKYCRWCPVTDCVFNRRGKDKASQPGPFSS